MYWVNNTALIVVDMQNAFCSPEGSFNRRGFSILNLKKVLETTKSLLSIAHKDGLLAIFTKMAYKQDYSDAGLLVKYIAPEIVQLEGYLENSWDSEIVETLRPQENDIIITKRRYDPFFNTNFEMILRENRITELLVVGLLTNVCVETCVRSAFDRDFKVTLVREGTSTYSKRLLNASLDTIEKHFGKVISYNELIELRNKLYLN